MTFTITEIHKSILQKYDEIWNKIKDLIGKHFGTE